ncbi:hypothetical protein [Acidithiobacillus sp.]|uniref:hypothetical protein n=1 Tax=Acidithiobacillus sp. TaxID=1872118 RepID=UPI003D03E8D6
MTKPIIFNNSHTLERLIMNGYLLRKTAVMAGCCCLTVSWILVSSPAASAFPLNSVLSIKIKPITNQALSQIVGRGVIGGKIVYFGVEMQTNWTAPNNQTSMSSTMNVALNSQGNIFKPTITYTMQGTLPQSKSSATNNVSGEGLNNIQGVTQAIQIGGNGNSVQNGMSLNVIKGAPNTASEGNTMTVGTLSNNGVTMTVQPGQLSMALTNDGTTIRQGIGSNGVFQISQVGTNMNNIQNHMALTLGVNPGTNNAQNLAQLQSVLSSLQPAP